MLFQKRPMPSFCSPHVRSGSPIPGCSTLITSAPNSPSIVATIGPAAKVAASMTRMPRSGRSGGDPASPAPRKVDASRRGWAPARGARGAWCPGSAHGTRRGAGARARRGGRRPRRRPASGSRRSRTRRRPRCSNHSSIWSAISGPVPDEARALQQGGPVPSQIGQRHGVSADVRLDVLHQSADARRRLDQLVGDRGVEVECPRSRSSSARTAASATPSDRPGR